MYAAVGETWAGPHQVSIVVKRTLLTLRMTQGKRNKLTAMTNSFTGESRPSSCSPSAEKASWSQWSKPRRKRGWSAANQSQLAGSECTSVLQTLALGTWNYCNEVWNIPSLNTSQGCQLILCKLWYLSFFLAAQTLRPPMGWCFLTLIPLPS